MAGADQQSVDSDRLREVCAIIEKLCLYVPESWQVDIKEIKRNEYFTDGSVTDEDDSAEKPTSTDWVTLTSPDGELLVYLRTGINSIGGSCDPDSPGKTYIINDKPTSLSGYSDEKINKQDQAHVLAVITTDGQFFTPNITLTASNDLIGKTEAHYCDRAFAGLLNDRNVIAYNKPIVERGLFSLTTTSGSNPSGGYQDFSSLDEAKKELEIQNFREAFDIIASVHY